MGKNDGMQKIKSWLVCLLCASLLAACGDTYSEPKDNEPSATVVDYFVREEGGLTKWISARVELVDNKKLAGLLSPRVFGINSNSYKIATGAHSFTVSVLSNAGFGGGQCFAAAAIPATLVEGETYHSKAVLAGTQIQVWMETVSGKKTSEIINPPTNCYEHNAPEVFFVPQK